jgi:hypothetical protein
MPDPLPNPLAASATIRPDVQVELRQGSARPLLYHLTDTGFLIGAVPGCDLQLPGQDFPPVVALIALTADGPRIRRLVPSLPFTINSQTLSQAVLADGDRIHVGPVELVIHVAAPYDENGAPVVPPRASAEGAARRNAPSPDAELRALDEQRAQYEADLIRLDRQRAGLDQMQRRLEDRSKELDRRTAQLQSNIEELVEKARLVDQMRLRFESEGQVIKEERAKLEAAQTELAERSALIQNQQIMLAQLRTRLDRRKDEAFREDQSLKERYAQQLKIEAELQKRAQDLERRQADFEKSREVHEQRFQQRKTALDAAEAQVLRARDTLADAEKRLQEEMKLLETRLAEESERGADLQKRSDQLAAAEETLRIERHLLRNRETALAKAELARELPENSARGVEDPACHDDDPKDWYRARFRDLIERLHDDTAPAANSLPAAVSSLSTDFYPADRALGEMLRANGMLTADMLTTLLAEAKKQRRPLRQLLLASGALTLYQLALLEAGNLEGLLLGPLRVLDRIHANTYETCYRVFDARRAHSAPGPAMLRHLAEAAMHEPGRADDFRRQFSAASQVRHPNLAQTWEVLEIDERPAALLEWINGLPLSEWPTVFAVPGVCLRLLMHVARALQAVHTAGLTHGHLQPGLLFLSHDGTIKVGGLGQPSWLAQTKPMVTPASESPRARHPADDLAALGDAINAWLLPATEQEHASPGTRSQALQTVLRRLSAKQPKRQYPDTEALIADLDRITNDVPANAEAWDQLVRYVRENTVDQTPSRRAA